MDKKSNMKQAMYEMFGVGADQMVKETEERAQIKASKPAAAPAETVKAAAKETAAPAPVKNVPAASYIAPGTVFEGTIRSGGDIEIAGEFKGDIHTEGVVVLYSNVHGNVTAKSLKLSGCSLVGDVVVKDKVVVSQSAAITGNITAREIQCAGQITGDMKVSENTSLEGSAHVNGSIATSSIAVVRGAVICGGIEIKPNSAEADKK